MQYISLNAALLVGLSLSMSGCSDSPSLPAATVRGVKVQRASETDATVASVVGVVRATNRAELSFVETGIVDKVLVEVGQGIKRGQPLVVQNQDVLAAALRSAQTDAKSARVALEAQRRETERQVALHGAGEVSDAQLSTAKANLEEAVARRDTAAANEVQAKWKHDRAVILAPYDGTVTARNVNPGAVAGAGQIILSVEDSSALQVVANVPTALSDQLSTGELVEGKSTHLPHGLQLKLSSVGTSVAGTGTVKAIFDIVGHPNLKTGEGVQVALRRRAAEGTSVPVQAIVFGDHQGKGEVFVFDPHHRKVQKRFVTFNADDSGKAHITSGVTPSDWVVIAGAAQLQDNQAAKAINGADGSAKDESK